MNKETYVKHEHNTSILDHKKKKKMLLGSFIHVITKCIEGLIRVSLSSGCGRCDQKVTMFIHNYSLLQSRVFDPESMEL